MFACAGDREVLGVGKDQARAAVVQQLFDLLAVEGGVQRNGGVSGGDYAQINRYPVGTVVGKNRATSARLQVRSVAARRRPTRPAAEAGDKCSCPVLPHRCTATARSAARAGSGLDAGAVSELEWRG